jgi:ATP-dependent DNA ligase
MLAQAIDKADVRTRLKAMQDSGAWSCEVKLDGNRATVHIVNGRVQAILTREDQSEARPRFPEVVAGLQQAFAQHEGEFLLDGELCALEPGGLRADYHEIQCRPKVVPFDIRMHAKKAPMTFVCFDIQYANEDVRGKTYAERRALIERLVPDSDRVRVCVQSSDILGLYDRVLHDGGEGVVLKRVSSTYEGGLRSGAWVKAKAPELSEDDLLVIGLTPGSGNRSLTFGSLILARRTPLGGLEYVVKAGSGLDHDMIRRIMDATPRLRVSAPPIPNSREVERSMKGGALMWLKPEIRADIVYERIPLGAKKPRHPRVKKIVIN